MPNRDEHRLVDINVELVKRLIGGQVRQYFALPLEAVQT